MKKIMVFTVILILLIVSAITISRAQDQWEWIDTGFDYILYDISFPEGQSEIGYSVGSTSTYDGDGIILKTTDGGDTWEQISQGTIPGLEAVFFTDLNTGYAGGWQNYFIKTTDGGQTWEEISVNPNIWFYVDIEFWDADNGIAVGYASDVYVTSDGGTRWIAANGVNAGIQDLEYASENSVFAVGGDEKILKSTDGGLNWTQNYSGTFQSVFFGVDFYNENYGVVGGEDGEVLITSDGGNNWTSTQASGFFLWHGVFCFNEDSTYIAGTPEGVYKTTDGGNSWIDDYTQSSYDVAFYKILFTEDNNTGFVCGSQGTIMRKITEDASPQIALSADEIFFPQTIVGESLEMPLTLYNNGSEILECFNIWSDVVVFYPAQTSVSVLPDDSLTLPIVFEPVAGGNYTGILTIESNDPQNPLIEVDLNGEGIQPYPVISVVEEIIFDTTIVNTTSTETIELSNIGNAPLDVSSIVASNPVIMVEPTSFSLGPGESQNIIVSFTPVNQGNYFESIEIFNNSLNNPVLISVSGFGLLQTSVHQTKWGKGLSAIPNPFREVVIITGDYLSDKQKEIHIYNFFGEFVTRIKTGDNSSGNINYIWNGHDQNGNDVPEGIYFGIIDQGKRREAIKLVKF